ASRRRRCRRAVPGRPRRAGRAGPTRRRRAAPPSAVSALLRGQRGLRRAAALVPAAALAAGGVPLALLPGSAEAIDSGTDVWYGLGAMLAIIGGNVLAIVLGRAHESIGVPRRPARAMVVLGVFGLVALVGFGVVADTNVLVGLVERCAVFPLL